MAVSTEKMRLPLSLLAFLVSFLPCTCALLAMDQPRVQTVNGHMKLVSGLHSNIFLETTGKGSVIVNGQNVIRILQLAVNGSSNRRPGAPDGSSLLSQLNDAINGPNGLLRRVAMLETQNMTTTSTTSVDALRRSVNGLSGRVTWQEFSVTRLRNSLSSNECASNPCRNGGTCEDKYSGFVCRCPSNWQGILCDVDVNECANFAGTDLGCQNGATCINKPGTYECHCTQGYYGMHCTQRSNDCGTASAFELCGHGHCQSRVGGGYDCLCHQGWTNRNGISCTEDVDECSSSSLVCSRDPPVPCINVPGSFHCGSCPTGYTGNGFYCLDINECEQNNGGCSLQPYVQCINTKGSRRCGECPAGYQGDGIICTRVGICGINNGGCHILAHCVENFAVSQSYAQCLCPSGYMGDGIGPNGCTPVHSDGGPNPCANNPCGSNGHCIPAPGNIYMCNCLPGYTGVRCTKTIDICNPDPCQNGGTCMRQGLTEFTCMCPSSFTGARCQERQQRCGGFLPNEAGTLTFPDSSSRSTSYPHSMSCAWVIITNSTKVLNVTFTSFHLEGSVGCTYDWLQVHDGRSPGDQLIGRFCGDTPPGGGHLISTHNALYLWFRSDGSVNREGFSLTWNSVQPECGGSITAKSHGSLQSPGSPGNYPRNRDCAWIIRAPLNNQIQFHFFSLRMENHTTCSFDFLRFYDGLSERDPLFAEFCNSSEPEPLTSPGSTVMIRFHSDNESSDTGFQIAYSTVPGVSSCGGRFTDAEKTITSPYYPQLYPYRIDCEWTIHLPPGERLYVEFTDFELEYSKSCTSDFIELRDGNSEESPLIGRYCGVYGPASFMSNGNKLYLRFRTDPALGGRGFTMKYHAVCGGVITAPSGQIHSPLYPNTYPMRKHCIWEIEQPLGKVIELNFVDFDLAPSLYMWISVIVCEFDALEIRDGHNKQSPLIGRYCDSAIPPTIISTYNHLWMEFTSDVYRQGHGFLANYTTIDTGCGGIMKGSNGTFESPRYPNFYSPGETCRWILAAPPGKYIQLTWDSFALEGDFDEDCGYDYVEIYDNSSIGALSMGRFCGERLPPVLITTGNIMTVVFQSDHSINYQGFSAHYNQIDTSGTCGHTFHLTMGVIQSPRYPQYYPPEQNCTWIISVPVGQQIMLNITNFEVQWGSRCQYDYLEIRNGGSALSPLVGKFCGTTIPRTITSHSHLMFIHFVTNNSGRNKGFHLTWDVTATGCGGIMTSPSGSFSSPNYPQNYHDVSYCTWKISTSRGSILQLVFIDIEMEETDDCSHDYVEIRDGKDPSGRLLGSYCSSSHPPFIRSSSNHMFVTFKSDYSSSGRGFHAKYNTVCNLDLHGFHGVIESPNFPEMYPNSLDCTWNIKAPRGHNVSIAFSHFELQDSGWLWNIFRRVRRFIWPILRKPTCCGFDFLEIKESFNNGTAQRTLLKECGSQIPGQLESHTNTVHVHFHTDGDAAFSGFHLEWTVKGCGGHLEQPFGEFTSPSYPDRYPDDVLCEWLITVEWGSSVQLTIEDFSMEHVIGCNGDSLTIYGGIDDMAPQLVHLCHTQGKAMKYTSSGNNMFIRFVSDLFYSGRGFKASFKTVPSRCGGHLTTPKGSIHSGNYPNNYDHLEDCMWLIEVEPNYRIKFTIIDIDIEFSSDCNDDYLAIYDGSSADNKTQRLAKLCGSSMPQPAWYLSTSNSMMIRFKSDGLHSSKGFLANYTVMCGARIVTEDAGQISMDESLDITPDTVGNCTWTIVGALPDDHVTLTVTHLEFSHIDATDCYPEYLEIRDGENVNATLIGKYCGFRIPSHITSHGNALFLNAVTMIGSRSGRFIAFYSVARSACGGDLTSESGSFATPGYPGSYPLDIECVWSIRTSPGNSAVITFSQFSLGGSNCDEDYVEVRRENGGGPLMGLYCSDSSLPSNLTAAHSIWVKFRSGISGPSGSGFVASYQLLHGNNLEGQSGQLASPLYPLPYKKYGTFRWRITVDFNHVITLTFKNFFIPLYVRDCLFSFLRVYDGYDETAPTHTDYCGGRTPESFTSTSNIIYIVLSTLGAREGVYFLLEWLQLEQVTQTPDYVVPPVNASGCGSTTQLGAMISTSQVNISSPNFGSGYEPMDCVWIFETPPTSHVAVKIRTLDVHAYSNWCHSAKVQIYNGKFGRQDWTLLLETCLSNASSLGYIHGSSLVKVVFHTNYRSHEHAGFSATVYRDCGGSLELPSGILEYSPQVPTLMDDVWKNNVVCQWKVKVPAGRNISVTFERFDVPAGLHGAGCDQNEFLMLKNGDSDDSPLLGSGKYCGQKPNGQLQTTGNKLFVKFVGHRHSEGFRIRFQQVSQSCGGNYVLTRDIRNVTISSPRYPQIPIPHVECIYIFTAPAGEDLQIEYAEHFDLRGYKPSGCPEEGIEVRDGGTLAAKIVDVYCGEIAPSTYTSSSNVLHIRYYTNTNTPHTGFQATVSIGKCGGTIRAYSGVIKSPGYPGKYERNIKCKWHVRAPYDYYQILNFQLMDIDLPDNGSCDNYDNVTVSEILPFNNTAVPLATFCGSMETVSDNLRNLQTTYSRALISFTTSGARGYSSYPYRGFHFTFNTTFNMCVQKLTGPESEVTSPGYPNTKDIYHSCQYDIAVPKGRRVSLDVLDMDLDNGLWYNRPSSFISVFDGGIDGVQIAYLTAQNLSAHIESYSNRLTLLYYANKASGHRGFKLHYSSAEPEVCGGILKPVGSGVLSSPSSNGSSYFCEWQWDALPLLENQTAAASTMTARTFTLKLLSVYISGPYEGFCRVWYSGIIIVTGELRLSVCKNITSPKHISSPFPSTKIVAKLGTDKGFRALQFSGQYSVSYCGGIIFGPEANVTSPDHPSAPSKDIHCAWAVTYSEGQRVKVHFNQVNIWGGPGEEHYLAIHNGESIDSPEIVHLTPGTTTATDIISETNHLWLEYHTGPNPSGSGFSIHMSPVISGCGGVLHDHNQELLSPNYPKQYPSNSECDWDIRIPDGYHVNLIFIERFQLENSTNCQKDYVEVFDYGASQWLSLGRLCGRAGHQQFSSTGNRMRVLFRSDDATNGDGFKALWNYGCGGIISDRIEGTVMSPGYPNAYSPNLTCNHTIVAPGHVMEAQFLDFSIEKGLDDCSFDNVTLFGAFHRWKNVPTNLGTYCGQELPPSISSRDRLSIIFRSDGSISKNGFLLKYQVYACGGAMSAPGLIKSPKSAIQLDGYLMLNCTWQIVAPANKIVLLRFTEFSMPADTQCHFSSSRMEVYDGNATDTKNRMGLFCSNLTDALPVISSTNNSMTASFITFSYQPPANFTAEVIFMYSPSQGCGGIIHVSDSPQTIQSVDIDRDGQYETFLDCHWTILANVSSIIHLEFDSFNTETCHSPLQTVAECNCDYLEVRDGGSQYAEMLGKFCGSQIPQKVITSSDHMWIRFVSDGTYNAPGFRAQVFQRTSPCGPPLLNVGNTPQELKSPGYPGNYPADIRCRWLLSGPRYLSIDIHIADLQISGGGQNCEKARLSVNDRRNADYIREGLGEMMVYSGKQRKGNVYGFKADPMASAKFCGNVQPMDFYSGTGDVEITFIATSDVARGFKLTYSSTGCNRNYSHVQGRIRLDRFTAECTIMISAPENSTVSLYVSDFYIGGDCNVDSMKAYDGGSNSGPLLSTMCGFTLPDPVFSSGPVLLLQLTRQTTHPVNIDLTYTTTDKGTGCGGKLFNTAGTFTSPMYPTNFRNISDCQWEISVPQNLHPYLTFRQFTIGSRSTCSTDFLEIYDLNQATGVKTLRTKYCVEDQPAPFEGATTTTVVRYVTSVNNGGSGWVIHFTAKHPESTLIAV
ncbi:cubilin-like [Schistocerca gregaria]|uniref:cubilin-like n=1 Tax=Schistocerca gregaria TaxID=7010 RepID=UPI00211DD680|nr:cubilin-like [Schistocerca gregaria]